MQNICLSYDIAYITDIRTFAIWLNEIWNPNDKQLNEFDVRNSLRSLITRESHWCYTFRVMIFVDHEKVTEKSSIEGNSEYHHRYKDLSNGSESQFPQK